VRGPDAVVIKEDEIERIRERIKSEMESLSESEVVEIPEELEGELEVAGEVKEDESEQAR
jgi:vacuolar-type H+-ATPase subunit F/Vma7